jgi:hypothetical protein
MTSFLTKNPEFLENRKDVLKNKYLKKIISENTFDNYFEIRISKISNNCFLFPNKQTSNDLSHREIFYSTFVNEIDLNFFEHWRQTGINKYNLISTNFNFKKIVGDKYENFICLHSEPNDNSTPRNLSKISPHLHFDFAFEPIRHSHIGLFIYEINEILRSIKNYDKAIELSLEMIKTEILNKF